MLLFYISSFGQASEMEKIFVNSHLKQLDSSNLKETNLIEKVSGKTVVLTSLVKGCKWILEEMAYYNKLKTEHPNELEVFVTFADDIETMSNYTKDVGFDFVFIHDPESLLIKKLALNDSIYTVLFDSKGNIEEKTNHGKMDRVHITNLLNKNQIQPTIRNGSYMPILNCQLKRYELGDEVSNETKSIKLPTKIMTGYKAHETCDTIENIRFCTITGENILGLYSYAYDLSPFHFIYDKEIGYINSHAPDHRYTLSLSVSSLHADFNQMLIQQIDLNFGMKSSFIQQESDILVLSNIDTENGNIVISKGIEKEDQSHSNIGEKFVSIKAFKISAIDIAKLIETATLLPVEISVDPKILYNLNISFENKHPSIDQWIELFAENGLIFRKEKKVIKKVEIKMASR